jgi:hypothetical protein
LCRRPLREVRRADASHLSRRQGSDGRGGKCSVVNRHFVLAFA